MVHNYLSYEFFFFIPPLNILTAKDRTEHICNKPSSTSSICYFKVKIAVSGMSAKQYQRIPRLECSWHCGQKASICKISSQPPRKAIFKRKINYKRTLQISICMKMKYTEKMITFQAWQTLLWMQLDTFQIDFNSKHIFFQIVFFHTKDCISYLKDKSRNRACL